MPTSTPAAAEQLRECLKPYAPGTRFTKEQLETLLTDKFGSVPSTLNLLDYCYHQTDKRKAKGPHFFLKIVKGRGESAATEFLYVGESYTPPTIEEVIEAYKMHLTAEQPSENIDQMEHYKWECIHHYQEVAESTSNSAEDFPKFYENGYAWAGKKFYSNYTKQMDGGNLLASGQYFAYDMFCKLARFDPEAMHALYWGIFDSSKPYRQRFLAFKNGCDAVLGRYNETLPDGKKYDNHYQDLRAFSVYLTFEQPEQYYLYKWTVYWAFRNLMGPWAEPETAPAGETKNLELCSALSEKILQAVLADPELQQMSRARLGPDCYQDEQFHILVEDIMFFGSWTNAAATIYLDNLKKGSDVPLNTILYGPPGTGKTYHTVHYALSIVEDKPLKIIQREPYDALLTRYQQHRRNGRITFTTFHQSFSYEDFVEGIRPRMATPGEGAASDLTYEIKPGIFRAICERARQHADEKHVIVIDEINRGNISKIFGELITLLEPPRRCGEREETHVTLPYSGEDFTVPKNIYLLGTMNTADRSITGIDTALRRRFDFVEMMPDPKVLEGIHVQDLSLSALLQRMNLRIEALYDREHTIGPAYFLPLRENPSVRNLAHIFRNKILPLLQEYFFDDYEKICLVLGIDPGHPGPHPLISARKVDWAGLFPGTADMEARTLYTIHPEAFYDLDAYRSILGGDGSHAQQNDSDPH